MVENRPVLSPPAHPPLATSRKATYAASLLVALLMTGASLLGLLYQTEVYPTEELRQNYVANDLVNLLIGLPILLGSLWLARRGRLVGLLLWPGALFYVFYNALVYTIALPVNVAFLLNLLQATLSVYTMIALVATLDARAVQEQLSGRVRERLGGGALMLFGLFFLLSVIASVAGVLARETVVPISERALHVADFIIAPALIIGGLALWRRQPLGYLAGLGLLFQATMLFIGLIAFLLLQPLLTTAPFQAGDLIVVTLMGLFCSLPFLLFTRAVWSQQA